MSIRIGYVIHIDQGLPIGHIARSVYKYMSFFQIFCYRKNLQQILFCYSACFLPYIREI